MCGKSTFNIRLSLTLLLLFINHRFCQPLSATDRQDVCDCFVSFFIADLFSDAFLSEDVPVVGQCQPN